MLSPDQIRALLEAQNLVPHRRMVCESLAVAADATSGRLEGELRRSQHTRAWALRVIAAPVAAGGDEHVAFFAINSGQDPVTAFNQLKARNGDHLQPGAKHLHTMPAWADRWQVDAAGLDGTDLSTQAAVTITVEVWELVPADLQEQR